MLLFGVTIPVTVPQRSEIPEGLMNNPVRSFQLFAVYISYLAFAYWLKYSLTF
jgi:hypothetical protein